MKNSTNKNILILVSHSGKQHVPRLLQALLDHNYSVIFFSPLWLQKMPMWIKWLPKYLQNVFLIQIRKKFFQFKGNIEIIQKPSLILYKELMERLTFNVDKLQLNLEKKHDFLVAGRVANKPAQIVIGYEISSVDTFKVAKQQKKITVLDLAQIHYKTISAIGNKFDEVAYFNTDENLAQIIERKQTEYDLADYIFVLSTFARQSMIDNQIDEKKLIKVSLGFDVHLFKAKQVYRDNGPLNLLICGTDMMRKGLGLLLQVLKQMESDGLSIRLTVVAPKIEAEPIVKKYGKPGFLTIYNFMLQEDLMKQYQQADLFVFPSYLDSWAMTVLEAMACGTPAIVTENTGSKDAVQQGGGIIIPTGDAIELRKSIEKFYYDRPLLTSMGKKAREIAMQYTWENYYTQIGEAIERIINSAPGNESYNKN